MSFSRFKLDPAPRRSAPVPIAAGRKPTSPEDRQHSSVHFLACPPVGTQPTASPGGNEPSPHAAGPPSVPRRGSDLPRDARGGCNSPRACRGRDRCRRCLLLSKQCVVVPSKRRAAGQDAAKPSGPRQTNASSACPGNDEPAKQEAPETRSTVPTDPASAFSKGSPALSFSRPTSCMGDRQLDARIDSLLSRGVAEGVFQHFVDSFAPKCPVVAFPPGTAAEHVRETKPLLFLAILGVASSGFCDAATQKQLAVETRRLLADAAIVQGEKTLEAVQALQVACVWYRVPDYCKHINMNQLAHVAVSLAIDLGLDRVDAAKPGAKGLERWARAETQRAWLGCFLLSASLALILRRPSTMSWTATMDDYLAELQQSEASPSDAFFCELVRAEQLCHAVDRELCLSDRSRTVSVRGRAMMETVRDLQSRIDGLPMGQVGLLQRALIDFGRFAASLYAHEIALHRNHNIEEFEAPFAARSLKTCTLMDEETMDATHLAMLHRVIVSSHGLLDAFLGLPLADMLTLSPHIYAGRVIYAIVLLLKLHKAISAAEKGYGGLPRIDELRVEPYLERLASVSQDLTRRDASNALGRAFLIMDQLKGWFYANRRRESLAAEGVDGTGDLRAQGEKGPFLETTTADTRSSERSAAGEGLPSACIPYGSLLGDDWIWEEFFNAEMLG